MLFLCASSKQTLGNFVYLFSTKRGFSRKCQSVWLLQTLQLARALWWRIETQTGSVAIRQTAARWWRRRAKKFRAKLIWSSFSWTVEKVNKFCRQSGLYMNKHMSWALSRDNLRNFWDDISADVPATWLIVGREMWSDQDAKHPWVLQTWFTMICDGDEKKN